MPYRDAVVVLGDIAEFRNGVNFVASQRGAGIPVSNVKDFQDRVQPEYDGLEELLPEAVKSESLLSSGDVVFVRSNGNKELIGRSMYLPTDPPRPTTHSAFTIRMRVTSAKADPQYCSYYLRGGVVRSMLSAQGSGTNISNLNQDILSRLQIWLPPLGIQHRIAGILSPYDDLIEVNTRRIAILEEIARRLIDEWFVNIRSSCHRVAQTEDTLLGPLPEGWRVGELQDLVILQRGFDLPASARTPGAYPVIAATGIHGTHAVAKVSAPGVVTGRSGSLGTVLHVDKDFWPLNTTLWGKAFPLGSTYYAFFVLQSIDLRGRNAGAAVPTLNRNDIHKLPVPIPPPFLVTKFDAFVEPLFKLTSMLIAATSVLRNTRDLLLAKLISGDIDLQVADRDVRSNFGHAAE
jgi:type I restriction enzyme S subunit